MSLLGKEWYGEFIAHKDGFKEGVEEGFKVGYETAKKELQEHKTGKWFDNADKYDKRAQKHDYFCLECKTHAMDFVGGSEDWWCYKPPKYCPNCGAKMEVGE